VRQLYGQVIAVGNYLPIILRSQFCSDKIACFATKHEAQRSARLYHQPAAATTRIARGHACSFRTMPSKSEFLPQSFLTYQSSKKPMVEKVK
jgi:hypothetical protein